jgi:predicted anti-sigma-YlaC factor YlaD
MSDTKNDVHERARKLIAWAGPEALSGGDRFSPQASANAWLAAHLETCAPCRAFADNAAETIRGMRAISIAAGRSLVSTTQMNVRRRALELRRRRERLGMVLVSCIAVTVGALVSTFILWRGFEWLGVREDLPSSVWQVAFLVFCVMPALVTGILLLAKDTPLARHAGSYRG